MVWEKYLYIESFIITVKITQLHHSEDIFTLLRLYNHLPVEDTSEVDLPLPEETMGLS